MQTRDIVFFLIVNPVCLHWKRACYALTAICRVSVSRLMISFSSQEQQVGHGRQSVFRMKEKNNNVAYLKCY